MIRRHSLVWLHSVSDKASTDAVEWHRAGRPFILCRTRPGEEVSFGFCLPGIGGGKPRTIPLAGKMSEISRILRPPELREVVFRSWSADLPDSVSELLNRGIPGCIVRVVGSRMWEALTGLRYVRDSSDWDLVADLSSGLMGDVAADFLEETGLSPDAELAFPGGGDVHWREWKSGVSPLLVKSLGGVRLCKRGELDPRVRSPAEKTDSRFMPDFLADRAVSALLAELSLYPKPGLVSPVDTGSHSDMDAGLLRASAEALHPFFAELAVAGARGDGFFQQLVPIGLRAESEMLRVTGGVNTHRGGIFALGLLVAAAARVRCEDGPDALRRELISVWSEELRVHARRDRLTGHGGRVWRITGLGGARQEAADGFPSLFECALPHLRRGIAEGLAPDLAAVDTLFLLIASLDDTNLVHRGGLSGSEFARRSARVFLSAGGVRCRRWFEEAVSIHHAFIARNLSPGGAADLLAATWFLFTCFESPTGPSAARPSSCCSCERPLVLEQDGLTKVKD